MNLHIYIGTEPRQWLAQQVLEYSIRSRMTIPVEIHTLPSQALDLPQQTGFSFHRWMVPELARDKADYALYLDADIVMLEDVAELLQIPMGGPIIARPRDDKSYYTSVMLMDVEALQTAGLPSFGQLVCGVEDGTYDYNSVMWATEKSPFRAFFDGLSARWNDQDIRKSDTAALHFTGLDRQPWKYSGHQFGLVFQTELVAALKDGHIRRADLQREIEAGHVRADILMNP